LDEEGEETMATKVGPWQDDDKHTRCGRCGGGVGREDGILHRDGRWYHDHCYPAEAGPPEASDTEEPLSDAELEALSIGEMMHPTAGLKEV
jgi:hypothetical protein